MNENEIRLQAALEEAVSHGTHLLTRCVNLAAEIAVAESKLKAIEEEKNNKK